MILTLTALRWRHFFTAYSQACPNEKHSLSSKKNSKFKAVLYN
jgi:hypothetical protein